jgi:hypothetical protein
MIYIRKSDKEQDMTIETTLSADTREQVSVTTEVLSAPARSFTAFDLIAAPYAIGEDNEEGIYYRVLNDRLLPTGYEINLCVVVTPDDKRIATRLINDKGDFVDEFGSIVGALNHVSRYGPSV